MILSQRFAVNPRAALTQVLAVASDALGSVFLAFAEAPLLADQDNNNDIRAATEIARHMVDATQKTVGLLTQGLSLRAQGWQDAITASAGGLMRNAADLNDRLADGMGALSPALGVAYKQATGPWASQMRSMAASRQSDVQRYFRTQNYHQVRLLVLPIAPLQRCQFCFG